MGFQQQRHDNQEFVPQGQTANAEFYETVLKHLLLHIQHVRPQINV